MSGYTDSKYVSLGKIKDGKFEPLLDTQAFQVLKHVNKKGYTHIASRNVRTIIFLKPFKKAEHIITFNNDNHYDYVHTVSLRLNTGQWCKSSEKHEISDQCMKVTDWLNKENGILYQSILDVQQWVSSSVDRESVKPVIKKFLKNTRNRECLMVLGIKYVGINDDTVMNYVLEYRSSANHAHFSDYVIEQIGTYANVRFIEKLTGKSGNLVSNSMFCKLKTYMSRREYEDSGCVVS